MSAPAPPRNQESVRPLHTSGDSANVMQRQILHNRFLEARTNFASPTDNLMSPCTAKLQAHKMKHYTKSKPQLLRFSQFAAESTPIATKENARQSGSMPSFGQ
ncbi:uncharacterized protein V1516DRAFT_689689 [Lipomyces oligophaga]|uniref:uncharacterized protein n=1 Tax=Lipomyces oligophaga TaxID=45792 RepID=UPI0034CF23BF